MIGAVIACTLLAAKPSLAENPPEGAPILPVSIAGDSMVCVGMPALYTCLNNEWVGWTNPVEYVWEVDGGTLAGSGSNVLVTWSTAGIKLVKVTHNSHASDGNNGIIGAFNGQMASQTVAVVELQEDVVLGTVAPGETGVYATISGTYKSIPEVYASGILNFSPSSGTYDVGSWSFVGTASAPTGGCPLTVTKTLKVTTVPDPDSTNNPPATNPTNDQKKKTSRRRAIRSIRQTATYSFRKPI